jgi:ribonuclease HII
MILAGIDEAGLGPILGPLVTSMSVFRVVEHDGDDGLYQRLRSCVRRTGTAGKRAGAKLWITDSKKLFHRQKQDGLKPLERGVLTMLLSRFAASEELPPHLDGLLEIVSPGCGVRARDYPWYGACDSPLPRVADSMDVKLAANAIRVGLRDAGVECLGLRAEPLLEGEFNRLVDKTNNKATAAVGQTARLLDELIRTETREPLRITVDRQGGRRYYRETLQQILPDGEMKILREEDDGSAYRIRRGEQVIEVSFQVGAEELSLPVALASMLSKYLRELFMERFNAFWAEHVPGLRPTAGYYQDGQRFWQDIQPAVTKLGIAQELLYRSR